MRQACVYIMANERNGTLYTGVTSDLIRRVYQHKYTQGSCFTTKYNCKLLVYYEFLLTMKLAIKKEKLIKGASRIKKLNLIENKNPDWEDLYKNLF